MKSLIVIFMFLFFCFAPNPFSFGQTNTQPQIDITQLISEVRKNAKYIAWHDKNEYSSNFKKTFEFKGEKAKRDVELFESVCAKRSCLTILTEHNGVPLSPEKIQKNREKTGKELERLDASPTAINADKENANEYGFSINSVYLQPSLYLKICDINSPERITVDSRKTIKFRFSNCKTDNEPPAYKSFLRHMLNTEGWIWIDEQDKMITKLEAFAKPSSVSTATNKPALTLSMMRVPEGFWFWSFIRLEVIDNKTLYSELKGNWQIDFSDYRRFRVDVDEPKINKP